MKQTAEDEDLYKLVSGWYGPGTMGCWYLLITSVFISWVFDPRYRFCVTNDLIAAILYPIIATVHLYDQIGKFPRSTSSGQYMVANLANFIVQAHNGPVKMGETRSGYPYPADPSSPERTEVYPLVASMNASLRVVNLFIFLAVITFSCTFFDKKGYAQDQLQRRYNFLWMVGMSGGVSWGALISLIEPTQGTADRFLIYTFMQFLILIWPLYCFAILLYFVWVIISVTSTIRSIYRHPDPMQKIRQHWAKWTRSIYDGDDTLKLSNALKALLKLALVFLANLAGLALFAVFIYLLFPRLHLFPPGGSTLGELDQAGALIIGLFPLGFTLHGVFRQKWRWYRENVGKAAESLLPVVHPHTS